MATRTGLQTHHDLPGICTFGPVPIPGLHFYDSKTLTSAQLRSQLARQGTGATYCVHSLRHILTGQQFLDWNQHEPDDQLIYVELLHTVDDDTPQRTQDLWLLRVDPKTGSVSPHNNDEDVWDLDSLINPDPQDTVFNDPIPHHEAMAIAREALGIHSDHRDFSDARALEQAMPAVAAAVTNFLVHRSTGPPTRLTRTTRPTPTTSPSAGPWKLWTGPTAAPASPTPASTSASTHNSTPTSSSTSSASLPQPTSTWPATSSAITPRLPSAASSDSPAPPKPTSTSATSPPRPPDLTADTPTRPSKEQTLSEASP